MNLSKLSDRTFFRNPFWLVWIFCVCPFCRKFHSKAEFFSDLCCTRKRMFNLLWFRTFSLKINRPRRWWKYNSQIDLKFPCWSLKFKFRMKILISLILSMGKTWPENTWTNIAEKTRIRSLGPAQAARFGLIQNKKASATRFLWFPACLERAGGNSACTPSRKAVAFSPLVTGSLEKHPAASRPVSQSGHPPRQTLSHP